MKKIVFIFALFFMPFAYANECAKNEVVIASCEISGKVNQMITFCANTQKDTIRYDFKRGKNTELTVNFNSRNKLKRWVDLGTYSTYLWFKRGEYSYIFLIPQQKPGAFAVLDVERNNKTISSKDCDSNSFGKHYIKMNSFEDVPDKLIRDNGYDLP